MIVADANVIAYLHIQGDFTEQAEMALRRDPVWAVPRLWRSEMRSVLVQYVRRSILSFEEARMVMSAAEDLVRGREFEVSSHQVFACLERGGVSAYDAEYVALAAELEVPLVTADRRLMEAFPEEAVLLGVFGG